MTKAIITCDYTKFFIPTHFLSDLVRLDDVAVEVERADYKSPYIPIQGGENLIKFLIWEDFAFADSVQPPAPSPIEPPTDDDELLF